MDNISRMFRYAEGITQPIAVKIEAEFDCNDHPTGRQRLSIEDEVVLDWTFKHDPLWKSLDALFKANQDIENRIWKAEIEARNIRDHALAAHVRRLIERK